SKLLEVPVLDSCHEAAKRLADPAERDSFLDRHHGRVYRCPLRRDRRVADGAAAADSQEFGRRRSRPYGPYILGSGSTAGTFRHRHALDDPPETNDGPSSDRDEALPLSLDQRGLPKFLTETAKVAS